MLGSERISRKSTESVSHGKRERERERERGDCIWAIKGQITTVLVSTNTSSHHLPALEEPLCHKNWKSGKAR